MRTWTLRLAVVTALLATGSVESAPRQNLSDSHPAPAALQGQSTRATRTVLGAQSSRRELAERTAEPALQPAPARTLESALESPKALEHFGVSAGGTVEEDPAF